MDVVCFREAKQRVCPWHPWAERWQARPVLPCHPSAEPRVSFCWPQTPGQLSVCSTLPGLGAAISVPGAMGRPRRPGCGPATGWTLLPARSQGSQLGKRQLAQVKGSAIDVELRASSGSAPRGHARPSHHPGPGLQGPGERAWALLRPTEGLRVPTGTTRALAGRLPRPAILGSVLEQPRAASQKKRCRAVPEPCHWVKEESPGGWAERCAVAPLPAHSHGHGGPQPRGDQADTGGEPFLPRHSPAIIPTQGSLGLARDGGAACPPPSPPCSPHSKRTPSSHHGCLLMTRCVLHSERHPTGVLEGHSPGVKVTAPELSKYPEHTQTECPNS